MESNAGMRTMEDEMTFLQTNKDQMLLRTGCEMLDRFLR